MPYSHQGRTERLIAMGRAVLAVLSLATMSLEPHLLARYAAPAYAIMIVYLVYSFSVAVVVRRPGVSLARLPLVTHILDLVWISALVFLTNGETSPFVVYLAFVLLAGTMRWRWQGATWTAAAVLVLVGVVSALHTRAFDHEAFELGHFLVLYVYTVVLAGFLGFTGFHENRLRDEIGRLAAWSREWTPAAEQESRMSGLLESAAATMDAKRALFVWDEESEPWLRLAYWNGSATEFSKASPTDYEPLVVAELTRAVFLCSDVRSEPSATALSSDNHRMMRLDGACLNFALADRFDMDEVVSVPVDIDGGVGRIFFLDKPRLSTEDLTLASVVGRGASAFMAEARLREKLKESAAFEERVRLARDLHDGVMQSLTGTALQLETARRLLGSGDPEATRAIEGVQKSLLHQQRELRLLVDTLDPYRKPPEMGPTFAARLAELAESVSQQWGLEAAVVLDEGLESQPADSQELAQDVVFIVHEAMANSGRHAAATHVTATVRPASGGVDVCIEDDGRGFGFEGRRDAGTLRSQGIGPMALISRVERHRGTLWVTSSPRGSRIEISLPSRPVPDDSGYADVLGIGSPREQPLEAV